MEPSHLVYLSGLGVYVVIRAIFQRRAAAQKKSVSKTDRRDRLLVLFVVVGKFILPMLFLFTPWLSAADYALADAAIWLGTPMMAAALWLFWRSHADLGKSWSVSLELYSNHRLVTQGVYRLVRHPMYASFFLFGLSQGLLLNNWLAGWATPLAVALMYFVRLPREEKMMLEHFGDEYRAYIQRTGGIIPRMRSL